jgi:hypothetical protein
MLFLEQAENRLVKGYASKDIHDLLLEKQLLYSATFSELSQQVSAKGGDRASEFLNRIWRLNQGLFESFIKLHDKQIREANSKVEAMRKHLNEQLTSEKHNVGKPRLPGSIQGMVMAQLVKIREKRHQAELAAHEARVNELTREIVFKPPKENDDNQKAPEQSKEPQDKNKNIDDFEQTERDEVIAMQYSGCAEELEKFAAQMLKGAATKMSDKSDSTQKVERKPTNIVADRWVALPGVVAAVEHFSAIVVVNVDLRKVLTRGQRIKIGSTSMCVHASQGKFSPLCVPMDRFWTGDAAKGLTVYIRSSDSLAATGEDSDMDDDEENIDWIVVPCVVTVTKGDNSVFTSSDLSKLIKRGTRVRIKNTVCIVSERGTLNYECFPINNVWQGSGEHGVSLFAEATGIWGWSKAQDAVDKKVIDSNKAQSSVELSPWIKTGITVDVTTGSIHAATHENATCVLLPGQVIKIGTHVVHVAPNGPFDAGGFSMNQPWEPPAETEMAIQIRRHELKITQCRLHESLRYLGENWNSSSGAAENSAAHSSVVETQTVDGYDGIERETQSELSVSPDEDLMMALMDFNQMNGTRIHQDPELLAARKIMLVSRRLEKTGTLPMDLHNCIHLFIQICREKKKADGFADMLKHRHLSIPEFSHDWFLERFGLVRISNENLARFVIGLQKHAATNPCARIAARSIGWIGTHEETGMHLTFRFSELMLDVYRDLMEHSMGYIADLSGQKAPAPKRENEDVFSEPGLTKGEIVRKNSAAITPRVSVLAAWDVLRVRLKSYPAARHHFGVVKKKRGGSKKRRRGRWIDMTKNSFVSSSFRKVEEIAHVSAELGGATTSEKVQSYIDTHAQGKEEKADARRISSLAVDLFGALEIILDTCKAAFDKEQAKTATAIRALFEESDKDHNGVLTILEFKSLMRAAGARPSQHKLTQFFSESMNENGRISSDSFAATVLHHCNLGDLKQIGHTSVRKIRRAAKRLKKKDGQQQDKQKNNDAKDVEEEKSMLDSMRVTESTDADVPPRDVSGSSLQLDTPTATKLKFACESCERSFVRQKGLDWHRENECAESTASKTGHGDGEEEPKVEEAEEGLAESSSEEEEVFTEMLVEDLTGQGEESDDVDAHHEDDDDLVMLEEPATFSTTSESVEPIARALLSKICRMTQEKDDIVNLEALWAMLSLDGESYLDITTFQRKIEQIAGFHPSNKATSALWLLLDEDRSGWLEKEEFIKFGKQVVLALLNGDALHEDELVIGDDPELRHLPTHIDSSFLDGWDLLLVTWENHEQQIRQLVIDFGGHEEKINLVLLGELCLEKTDINAAWEAYRALSAFESRMV